jgi:hypothetical protein
MPVILKSEDHERWLDPGFKHVANILNLLKPHQGDSMRRYSVSSRVNSVKNDDTACADSLEPNQDDENFDVLAKQVRSAIEGGTPELGLDRLHTFVLKYIRTIYERHFGRSPNRTATANSLLGEFANDLRQKGVIQSKMTSEILKSSAPVLDEFNYVRNNQTLAHDNPELINKEEAYFIYKASPHPCASCVSLRRIRELRVEAQMTADALTRPILLVSGAKIRHWDLW